LNEAKLKASGFLKDGKKSALELKNFEDTSYTGPVFFGTPW